MTTGNSMARGVNVEIACIVIEHERKRWPANADRMARELLEQFEKEREAERKSERFMNRAGAVFFLIALPTLTYFMWMDFSRLGVEF